MGFKCAPQILGLVRGEPKKGQKHRANGKAILSEAGKERYSASETLDRSLSHLNKYAGTDNGFAAWDAMRKRADAYRTQGKTKDGKDFERALRKDAVIGFALIINPPAEECINWSSEEYRRFYHDTWDCLHDIEPRIFDKKNIVMQAEHYDEGIPVKGNNKDRHLHVFGNAIDETGHYCGNLIDAQMFVTINQRYPEMMRQKGWDMEDLDTTDWDRYQQDEEYRSERKAKSRKSGKSVNEHIKADMAKKTRQVQSLSVEVQSLTAANALLSDLNDNLNLDVSASKTETIQLQTEKAILQKQNQKLKLEQTQLLKKKESLTEELYDTALELKAVKHEVAEQNLKLNTYEVRQRQNQRFESMLQRLQNADFIQTFLKRLGIRKWRDAEGILHQKSYLSLYEEALERYILGFREEADAIRKGEEYQHQLESGSGKRDTEYSF